MAAVASAAAVGFGSAYGGSKVAGPGIAPPNTVPLPTSGPNRSACSSCSGGAAGSKTTPLSMSVLPIPTPPPPPPRSPQTNLHLSALHATTSSGVPQVGFGSQRITGAFNPAAVSASAGAASPQTRARASTAGLQSLGLTGAPVMHAANAARSSNARINTSTVSRIASSGRANADYIAKMAQHAKSMPMFSTLSTSTDTATATSATTVPAGGAGAIDVAQDQVKNQVSSFIQRVRGITAQIAPGVSQLTQAVQGTTEDLRSVLLDDTTPMGLQPAYDITSMLPQGFVSFWRTRSFEHSWKAGAATMYALQNASDTLKNKPALHEWTTCCTSTNAANGLYAGGFACLASTSPLAVIAKYTNDAKGLDVGFGVDVTSGNGGIPGMRLDLQPEPSFVRRMVYAPSGTLFVLVGVGNPMLQQPMTVVMAINSTTGLAVDSFGSSNSSTSGASAYVSFKGSQPPLATNTALAAKVMGPGCVLLATDAQVTPLDMTLTSDNRLLVLVDGWDGVSSASRAARVIALDSVKGQPIVAFGEGGVLTLPESGTSVYTCVTAIPGADLMLVGGAIMMDTPRASNETLLMVSSTTGGIHADLSGLLVKAVDVAAAAVTTTTAALWWSPSSARHACVASIVPDSVAPSSYARIAVNVWDSVVVGACVVVADVPIDGKSASGGSVAIAAPDAVQTQALSMAIQPVDGSTLIVGRALTATDDLSTTQTLLARVSGRDASGSTKLSTDAHRLLYADGQPSYASAAASVPTGFLFVGAVQRGKHALHRWAFVAGADTLLSTTTS